MKKALIITTVSGFVPQFEMNNVRILQSMNYEVHYASNFNNPIYGKDNHRLDKTGIIRHQIDFVRSPFNIKNNLKAYKQLKCLLKSYKFDLVHCHTPMGGVLGRMAAQSTKTSPVIYTAHGFHFFKGASFVNWILYYPIEKLLAHFTDVLITINREDYKIAKKFKLRHNGTIEYIKGIGINTEIGYNKQVNKFEKLKELGVRDDSFLLTSVGELTHRKNHKTVIQALAKINNKNITYLICGTGALEDYLKQLVKKLKLDGQVIFAGYRSDINEILRVSDCFIFPSLQEGLPVALLEAMALGLPVICSKIRGNIDLIDNNKGGILVDRTNDEAFGHAVNEMINDRQKLINYGIYNKEKVKEFDIRSVGKNMDKIYRNL